YRGDRGNVPERGVARGAVPDAARQAPADPGTRPGTRARRARPDRTGAVLSHRLARARVRRRRRPAAGAGRRQEAAMSAPAEQFPYVPRDPAVGDASLAPMLPINLAGARSVTTSGLVDSGAAINVLPLSVGAQLGFDWKQETRS